MNWISVKERLPEPDSYVLVTYAATNTNTVLPDRVDVAQSYFSEDNIFYNGRDNPLNNEYWEVTHWMPLPDPPDDTKSDQAKMTDEENSNG